MDDISKLDYRPCVGIMVLNQQRNIFTAQRLGFSSEAWQMPQGGIEKGEDTFAAAYRELEEEPSIDYSKVELLEVSKNWLTYDLPSNLIPKLWNGSYRGQTQKWFLMNFVGVDNDINLQTSTPEFSSWRWSNRQQLLNGIVPFKKELYRAVIDEFHTFF